MSNYKRLLFLQLNTTPNLQLNHQINQTFAQLLQFLHYYQLKNYHQPSNHQAIRRLQAPIHTKHNPNYLDKKRIERNFQIGDWVYTRLESYRQSTTHHRNQKLEVIYYGPFQIWILLGRSLKDYSCLQMLEYIMSFMYPCSNQSTRQFKLWLLLHILPCFQIVFPQTILGRREVKRRKEVAALVLVQWQGLFVDKRIPTVNKT